MNERHFAHKVRQHLNRGLYELPPATEERLAAARQMALAHQKQAIAQSILTTGNFLHFHIDIPPHYKQVIAVLALAIFGMLATVWLADQRVNELSAIDSALLTDDLPVKAFTDKGFNAWLKQASP